MTNITWSLIRSKLREALLTLPQFFKNPVQGMRQLPDWDWPTMLILQGSFAAACAILASIVERSLLGVFTGLILAPIAAFLMVTILSGFFYYTFLFFFKREIPFRQIYLHMIFAAIPSHIVMIVSGLIPPLFLVGAAATMILLYVGFVENLLLERRKLRQLMIGMFSVYALFWAFQLVQTTSKHERLRLKATPESLDILEKELNLNN